MAEFKLKKGSKVYHIREFTSVLELARRGHILPDDPIYVPTVDKWVYARSIQELRPVLQDAPEDETAAEITVDLPADFVEPLHHEPARGATIEIDVADMGLDISAVPSSMQTSSARSEVPMGRPEPSDGSSRAAPGGPAQARGASPALEPLEGQTVHVPVMPPRASGSAAQPFHARRPFSEGPPASRVASPQVPLNPYGAPPSLPRNAAAQNDWAVESPTDPGVRGNAGARVVSAEELARMFDRRPVDPTRMFEERLEARPAPEGAGPWQSTVGAAELPPGEARVAAFPAELEVAEGRVEGRFGERSEGRVSGSYGAVTATTPGSPPQAGASRSTLEVPVQVRSGPLPPLEAASSHRVGTGRGPGTPPPFEHWMAARSGPDGAVLTTALLEDAVARVPVLRRKVEREPGVHWGRLAVIVFLLGGAFGAVYLYIRSMAFQEFPALEVNNRPVGVGGADPTPSTVAQEVDLNAPDPEDQARDVRLREQIRPQFAPLRDFDSAQDDLFGELLNLRVSLGDVKIEPLSGPRTRSVRSTECDVRVRLKPGRYSFDEQTALTALVVGRYVFSKRMAVKDLIVQLEPEGQEPILKRVSGQTTADYFSRLLDYRQFTLALQSGTQVH